MTNDILKQAARHNDMQVPEGYFDDFATRMAASLPRRDWEDSADAPKMPRRRTTWQIIRPYVYMAAMFCGVWLMMQIFNQMQPTGITPDNNPVLAEALQNESFINNYIIDDSDSDDLLYDVWDSDM